MSAFVDRAQARPGASELVTATLAGQEIAMPVTAVQDVLGPQPLTPVPRAVSEVAGLLNLRGRIVTAIDLRPRLGIQPEAGERPPMNIVLEHDGELYSLLVDAVGEVIEPPDSSLAREVTLLSPAWRRLATGIYALQDRLLVALDIARVLDFRTAT
jgi:purine-binding chemotaxis protein CheW